MLTNKRFFLGITSSIACYKAIEIIRLLQKKGATVQVGITKNATHFINPVLLQHISGNPVYTEVFSSDQSTIDHIQATENIDGFIIAPATANILAKMVCGIADDFISTAYLGNHSTVFIAPAMNMNMWGQVITQENVQKLQKQGIYFIGPEKGELACKVNGIGRMSEPITIVEEIQNYYEKASTFIHKKVLITAGATKEAIDPIRFISNHSSGKMGYALAQAFAKQGAEVLLVSGETNLEPPHGVSVISVKTADQMYQTVIENAPSMDILIKCAAVSDYTIKNPANIKLQKQDSLTLELVKTKDILKKLGEMKQPHQYLVGFAAQTDNVLTYARRKYKEKNVDLMVANQVGLEDRGFYSDTNQVTLLTEQETIMLPLLQKTHIAEKITDFIATAYRI